MDRVLPVRGNEVPSRISLPTLTALAAFLIDVKTPNGMMDGFLYVSAVLVCVWVPDPRTALHTAFGLMLPMCLGFLLSPSGASLEVALANRCVAVGTTWLAAIAVWRNAREKDVTLAALHRELQGLARAAEAERAALSEWLRQEVSLELTMVDWRLNHLAHQVRRGAALQSEALLLRRAIQRASQSIHGKMLRLGEGGQDLSGL
jgi:hypothetical protein